MTKVLQESLRRAQNRMKQQSNKHRTDREFSIGDWVIKKIGNAAYELKLPPTAKIHPVFYVSKLKKKIGTNIVAFVDPPTCTPDGVPMTDLVTVLGRRMIKRGNQVVAQVLIQWSNLLPEESTWNDFRFIKSQLPHFKP
ncbi:uncharacterized protein [Nicotiana sylvestris]|uniref:uncharacterized protein n=1 Tax=Nicotiana sylvestris TaxID=4096 RepID=UPI00388C595E